MATPPTRIASCSPMIREKITDPWREVTWEEAIAHTAKEFRRIQYQYGRTAIGGITSSRCTNEETYLVQKLVRQGFRNNNVDTCARVCHSPTGYGLGQTYGTSAGTQDFDSVDYTDVADRHRRQSRYRPSGVRLAAEEAAAPGRQADRARSAPHRDGQVGACRSGLSPAAEARHQCGGADCTGACHRHRRSFRRSLHPRTLRLGGVPGLGVFRRLAGKQP